MSVPAARSRYRGQFVVSDIQNSRKYLCDLIWSWSKGLDLTGWTLGGTTVPTIAADGQIDLYDNTNLANQNSIAKFTIPNTLGPLYCIFKCKFTRQADDTGADDYSILLGMAANLTPGTGISISKIAGFWRNNWVSNGSGGNTIMTTQPAPVINREYELSLIMTPTSYLFILDGVKIHEILASNIGNAILSATPSHDWLTANKTIHLYTRHQAGEISHYRVHDIKVGRLVGVSSP